jgi:hypothetical protein
MPGEKCFLETWRWHSSRNFSPTVFKVKDKDLVFQNQFLLIEGNTSQQDFIPGAFCVSNA